MTQAASVSKIRWLLVLAVAAMVAWLPACRGGNSHDVYAVYTGGNWQNGAQLIQKYHCGACHVIPGIYNATELSGHR